MDGNTLENIGQSPDLQERLTRLEYGIRQSITVREDQEDEVDPAHRQEAELCGIPVQGLDTKGDLLNAVQTAVRAARARAAQP